MWSLRSLPRLEIFQKFSIFLWTNSKSLSCHTFVSAYFIFICCHILPQLLPCNKFMQALIRTRAHTLTRSPTPQVASPRIPNLAMLFQTPGLCAHSFPPPPPWGSATQPVGCSSSETSWSLCLTRKMAHFLCVPSYNLYLFHFCSSILDGNDWAEAMYFTRLRCPLRARPESSIFISQAPM